jgi:D-glycero-D-manno-heptose 1,7-bisphosphate phosphatase
MNRAAFLDRDGVINRKAPVDHYILSWEDVQFLPGVAQAIALLNRNDFRVIVVSNQRCVANGLITTLELDSIHERMRDAMVRAGATIDAFYYCPHELQPPCSCRKPLPGMLLEAASKHGIDLTASWMIGDSEIDIVAGRNAGCKTVRLLTGDETDDGSASLVATSLLDASRLILQREPSRNLLDRPQENDRSTNTANENLTR